jgi:signal transduction histidine kinase
LNNPATLKILIVEDNHVDQFLLVDMLDSSELNVARIFSADRASAAMEILTTEKIDIVLLDLTLPESNGIDSFHLIKNCCPSVPVIILTGNSDFSIASEALKEGAQDFLVKGEYSASMLSRAISYSMERKKFEEVIKESETRFTRKLAEYEKLKRIDVTKATLQALESERKFIGEELHDNINQILSSVKIYLEVAKSDPENSGNLIAKSHEYICNAIKEIRNISNKLIAPGEQLLELSDMIRQMANDIALTQNIEFSLDLERCFPGDLLPEQRIAVFRIVQEQFNNIQKYSNASHVHVLLENRSPNFYMRIEDDGVGTDLLSTKNGLGLTNMTSRVELYNGKIHMESAPGKGFLLEVIMDIQKN